MLYVMSSGLYTVVMEDELYMVVMVDGNIVMVYRINKKTI